VVLQGVDLFSQVVVSMLEGLIRETQIVLLSPRHRQVFFAISCLSLKRIQLSGKLAVAREFIL